MIQKAPSNGNTNTEYNRDEIFIPKYVRLVYVRGAQIPGTGKSVTLNFAVVPNISESSVWNLFSVTLLAPTILRVYLDFWKTYIPLASG
jgi:hypothetical protein